MSALIFHLVVSGFLVYTLAQVFLNLRVFRAPRAVRWEAADAPWV